MKKVIIITVLSITSFASYSQTKTEIWEKQYIRKADSLYRKSLYNLAITEYLNASKMSNNDYAKHQMDSCRKYIQISQSNKDKELKESYKAQRQADSAATKKWRLEQDSIRESKKPQLSAEDKAYYKLEAQVKSLTPRGLTTPFCNYRYNFVTVKIQNYIRKYMNMSLNGDKQVFKNNVFTDIYSGNKTTLKFNYNVIDNGSELVIKGCKITGDRISLISFFIDYWPTKLTVDDKSKVGVYTCQFLEDVIDLHLDGENSFIEITKVK